MNILWIVADTLRSDRLGCYSYFRNTSPTIDRLAREGVLFEDCYSSAISTGAAFTCLFTGLPAIRHRYYITPANKPNLMNFDDTIPTLPEIIQTNSQHTTVAVDNLITFAGHMKQTVRGFEFYINVTRDGGFRQPEYTAGEANARFLPWLRAHAGEPFFAFMHLWDAHHNPYRAPGFRDRFRQAGPSTHGLPIITAPAGYQYVPGWGRAGEIVYGISAQKLVRDVDGGAAMTAAAQDESAITQDLYDCSIAYLDSQIQCILDALQDANILDQTAIVFTADHGEGLGNHGVWGHGLLYEDTIHIPLVLWRPGLLPSGRRAKGFVQHVDISPTILDLLEIAGPGQPVRTRLGAFQDPQDAALDVHMEGRSLLPLARGSDQPRSSAITEVRRGVKDPGYRSIRVDQWKLIENLAGERQLYDLASDPMEKINLAVDDTAQASHLAGQIADWVHERLPDDGGDPMRFA